MSRQARRFHRHDLFATEWAAHQEAEAAENCPIDYLTGDVLVDPSAIPAGDKEEEESVVVDVFA